MKIGPEESKLHFYFKKSESLDSEAQLTFDKNKKFCCINEYSLKWNLLLHVFGAPHLYIVVKIKYWFGVKLD